jgi:hypothetical protein
MTALVASLMDGDAQLPETFLRIRVLGTRRY